MSAPVRRGAGGSARQAASGPGRGAGRPSVLSVSSGPPSRARVEPRWIATMARARASGRSVSSASSSVPGTSAVPPGGGGAAGVLRGRRGRPWGRSGTPDSERGVSPLIRSTLACRAWGRCGGGCLASDSSYDSGHPMAMGVPRAARHPLCSGLTHRRRMSAGGRNGIRTRAPSSAPAGPQPGAGRRQLTMDPGSAPGGGSGRCPERTLPRIIRNGYLSTQQGFGIGTVQPHLPLWGVAGNLCHPDQTCTDGASVWYLGVHSAAGRLVRAGVPGDPVGGCATPGRGGRASSAWKVSKCGHRPLLLSHSSSNFNCPCFGQTP